MSTSKRLHTMQALKREGAALGHLLRWIKCKKKKFLKGYTEIAKS